MPVGTYCNILRICAIQVSNWRYKKSSIILTSNRGFADWGQAFAGQEVAGAITDRLLHRHTIINIRGKSYRMCRHPTTKIGDAAIIR